MVRGDRPPNVELLSTFRIDYVSDVFASPRDANTVFVALNNWQRGDYKPYLVKSTDRGRTWTSIASDLPDRHAPIIRLAPDSLNEWLPSLRRAPP